MLPQLMARDPLQSWLIVVGTETGHQSATSVSSDGKLLPLMQMADVKIAQLEAHVCGHSA